MAVLNSELVFSDASADVRTAFSGGKATKRLFNGGHQFFKFTKYVQLTGSISPWWSSVEPINDSDMGLEGLMKRAGRLGVTANSLARARNSVTKEWNSMTDLLIVRLRVSAFGFVGRVAAQPVTERSKKVVFIGGALQVWIPDLTLTHITKV